MIWNITFLEEAQEDLRKLNGFARIQVLKGIQKVSQNPLSATQGGYGKPFGSKNGTNLTNLLKIKFRDLGVWAVYKIEITNSIMNIIITSTRTDEQVYEEAKTRRNKHHL